MQSAQECTIGSSDTADKDDRIGIRLRLKPFKRPDLCSHDPTAAEIGAPVFANDLNEAIFEAVPLFGHNSAKAFRG